MVQNVKITKKEMIANGTMAIHLEKPEGFIYTAGQFGDITLLNPPETDDEGNTRGFSLASAPHEDFLMMATRLRDTAFKRVLKDLPEGTEIKLDAPYGDFTLHKNESKPAVFIIGGIGVTPIRSIISQATHDKTGHQLTLIHANRTPEDAPFANDFEELANANPNFTYVAVAEQNTPDGWPGEIGRINGDIVKKYVQDLQAARYYLSGPEGMVKAMRQMLVELQVDEDTIRTEEFSGY